jgi:hypothetical protein
MTVLNPDVTQAHMAIYVEYQGVGQSVLVNFDQSGSINHTQQYCSGSVPLGRQPYNPGNYEGRVDLFRTVLEDVIGLPSTGAGTGGTSDTPDRPVFKWALHQNAPNPVAAGTEIRYEVARTSDVKIKIYNAMGQLVQTVMDGQVEPGRYAATWDARNLQGDKVAAGVYFYRMSAGQYSATKKMLVVR